MPPRQRTYKAEYAARLRRAEAEGLPKSVAAGHGPVNIKIARELEKARRSGKPPKRNVIAETRKGSLQYQKTYWGTTRVGGRIVVPQRGRRVPQQFPTYRDAESLLIQTAIPTTYADITQGSDGQWTIYLLH